jgi:hypothetical protein
MMTASSMKSKIEAQLASIGVTVSNDQYNYLIALCRGIIEEIQENAQVKTGIPVSTTGGPTAQTGATTSPGSIE